ncbi:sigma-54-dependent transcriptional regulator [Geomesophilobacter sediminis]|uniref:Sigma-54-dependent Fis family transcriptional regulator n=1 Tax=Geomesophilobacter sediminis TaxID=2798584 RepID=A0A8J7LUW6_9BACT|nr:sigma-54 dependent transcriptional regulator [Geomesophilobacter sediminis]MBJ6725129.1 sigma-54-dependent Fis family transcriptional regulator [Geomesophilobacter sediminis]
MTAQKRVMVIDNEEGLCRMMEAVLSDNGYQVTAFTRSFEALETFTARQWDIIVTDIKMPGMDGLELLQKIKQKEPSIPVIMVTAYATVEMSIQALRKGAYDMLTKPFEPEELLYRVKNALKQTALMEENRELREELVGRFHVENIIGASSSLRELLERVEKVAVRDTSVLITGESGTGKELIAQAIHYNSPRKEKKFVAINCGALPASLLESELFGYRKGAFTGASENRRGLLETADGGTLFLDEVGNLPMTVQKTLLRFLQEQEFNRIGDPTPTKVDVRVLSATNADMKHAVKQGEFREDLYYRLNVVNLHLPPLRERKDDLPLLAAHFIRQQNEKFATAIKGLTPEALEAATNYHWPGNIRQLKNVVEACLAMESGEYIGLPVLSQFIEIAPQGDAGVVSNIVEEGEYARALSRFETEYLRGLLRKNGGNVEAAAKEAGTNMATIYRKIKKYGIRKDEYAG